MFIISSRKNFHDSDQLSNEGHQIREIDLSKDKTIKDLSPSALKNEIKGKNVLILVHGYNNEQFEVFDAYEIIENKINTLIPGVYDYVIGYSWPGGNEMIEWWQVKSRSNSVARLFRFLIEDLAESTSNLDLMSHSLGARVALKALKECEKQQLTRNYYCTAAAVDNECLEPREEFFQSLTSFKRLFVFHTARDRILNVAYRASEWDLALGLYGPEDINYISQQAKMIYVANCKKIISYHGGYKKSDQMYKYIGHYQGKNPSKFKTL